MKELSLAYLFAIFLIGVLIAMARENRRSGWQRTRESWLEVQAVAAARAFEAREEAPADLQHTGDLGRLHQSLATYGASPRPETVPPGKAERFLQSR